MECERKGRGIRGGVENRGRRRGERKMVEASLRYRILPCKFVTSFRIMWNRFSIVTCDRVCMQLAIYGINGERII